MDMRRHLIILSFALLATQSMATVFDPGAFCQDFIVETVQEAYQKNQMAMLPTNVKGAVSSAQSGQFSFDITAEHDEKWMSKQTHLLVHESEQDFIVSYIFGKNDELKDIKITDLKAGKKDKINLKRFNAYWNGESLCPEFLAQSKLDRVVKTHEYVEERRTSRRRGRQSRFARHAGSKAPIAGFLQGWQPGYKSTDFHNGGTQEEAMAEESGSKLLQVGVRKEISTGVSARVGVIKESSEAASGVDRGGLQPGVSLEIVPGAKWFLKN